MSDELFALSQNIPQLIDNFRGPSQDNTVQVTISRSQAGIFLRSLIYPKKSQDRKEEAVQAGAVEVAIKLIKNGDSVEKSIAAGVLQSLTQVPVGLTTMMDNKPSPLPILWAALNEGMTSLAAGVLGIIRNICENIELK
jgi:hypothetical protein